MEAGFLVPLYFLPMPGARFCVLTEKVEKSGRSTAKSPSFAIWGKGI
jgi:hypothetical protein